MNFQFYLDKPFLPKVDKLFVQGLIKEGKNVNKFLNPNDTSIYAWLTFPGKHYIKVNTSERIAARWWDFKLKKPRRVMAGSAMLSDRLEDIKHQILKNYRALISINPHPTLDEIRKVAKDAVGGITPSFNRPTFMQHYEEYLKDKKSTVKPLTYTKLKSFKNVFNKYLEHINKNPDQFYLENFTDESFTSMRSYLFEERNDLNNTASKHFDTLRTFLRHCKRKGVFKEVRGDFENYSVKRDKTDVLFFTEYELEQIMSADLSYNQSLQQVRDCFIFLCFTGQRYSDLKALRSTDILRSVDGWEWHLFQEKTNKRRKTIVPLVPQALKVLEKYGLLQNNPMPSKLPVLSNQKMNEKLKLVCKEAKIDQVVTVVKYSGQRRITIQKPKWQLAGTHLGRKSFITGLVLKNMSLPLIMQVSGHSSIRVLQNSYQGLSVSHLHASLHEALAKDLKKDSDDKTRRLSNNSFS